MISLSNYSTKQFTRVNHVPLHCNGMLMLLLTILFCSSSSRAAETCTVRAIITAADVSVSEGADFKIETYFQSVDAAAIQFLDEPGQLVIVEGPYSWLRAGDDEQLGDDNLKAFALGHQFHALWLYFDEAVTNSRQSDGIFFGEGVHQAISGDYIYGGTLHLLASDRADRPLGILLDLPEAMPISAQFFDWRENGETALPYHVQIDDGQSRFDYHFTRVDLTQREPLWFSEVTGTPDIDEIITYRAQANQFLASCQTAQ